MTARRGLLALGLIGLLSTCADPTSSGAPRGFARVAVRAVAPPSLVRFAPSLVIERVKVVLSREFPQQERSEPIDSTTVPLADDQNTVSTSFRLLVSEAETLAVRVDYSAGDGTLLFEAFDQVVVRPGASIPTPALQPFYVGPGFNIASMSLSPFDSVLSAGDALTFDPSPTDASGLPVPQFYVSWATDDPRVPIDARGRIVAPPNLTKEIFVSATTPNGIVGLTTVRVLGPAALGISPDSVEKLPNGTQSFGVTVDLVRANQYIWSVNGVDGGNATFGTIDAQGFYTAPATTPTPSKFPVCARDAASPARQGCATVVIRAVPSVGADVIVINDENIFDPNAMNPDSSPGNVRFVKNLVNFTGTGPRSSGTVVWYDRGRNSPCFLDGECGDVTKARFDSVIRSTGKSIVKFDSYTRILNVPPNVKVIILWMPLIFYDFEEINTLRRFAREGGRIVFIGEHALYYGSSGIAVENDLLAALGSQMVNVGDTLDCRTVAEPEKYFVTPAASLRANPLLTGVASLRYACASQIQLGPNDAPLFYDQTNAFPLAGVAKIDIDLTLDIRQPPAPIPTSASPPTVGGAGTARRW